MNSGKTNDGLVLALGHPTNLGTELVNILAEHHNGLLAKTYH